MSDTAFGDEIGKLSLPIGVHCESVMECTWYVDVYDLLRSIIVDDHDDGQEGRKMP